LVFDFLLLAVHSRESESERERERERQRESERERENSFFSLDLVDALHVPDSSCYIRAF
jgi:hypothetical protein